MLVIVKSVNHSHTNLNIVVTDLKNSALWK